MRRAELLREPFERKHPIKHPLGKRSVPVDRMH
jgi:hypothetical protein